MQVSIIVAKYKAQLGDGISVKRSVDKNASAVLLNCLRYIENTRI